MPARRPLRKIKAIVDPAVMSLDADFSALYASEGRPSIAPERRLMEQLNSFAKKYEFLCETLMPNFVTVLPTSRRPYLS